MAPLCQNRSVTLQPSEVGFVVFGGRKPEIVIPAQAGIQACSRISGKPGKPKTWIPACAGMTGYGIRLKYYTDQKEGFKDLAGVKEASSQSAKRISEPAA